MYLIDTNIWLELLLEQERSKECRIFFERMDSKLLFISEFSLYSIGVILFKLKKESVFDDFLEYLFKSEISVARLSLKDMKQLVLIKQKFNLDFDDAYQYVVAEKFNLIIVSFDSNFDKTYLGRKTPNDFILQFYGGYI
jgi:Predicted nucleic acid-binding protein, contains PIN domain